MKEYTKDWQIACPLKYYIVNLIISSQKPFNPYTVTIAMIYIHEIETIAIATFKKSWNFNTLELKWLAV